jgi:hypothetical protein
MRASIGPVPWYDEFMSLFSTPAVLLMSCGRHELPVPATGGKASFTFSDDGQDFTTAKSIKEPTPVSSSSCNNLHTRSSKGHKQQCSSHRPFGMIIDNILPLNQLHGAEPFLRSRQLRSYSRISQHFMEPEGSLSCSQEPSTGTYSKPDQSSPYHPILYLYDRS